MTGTLRRASETRARERRARERSRRLTQEDTRSRSATTHTNEECNNKDATALQQHRRKRSTRLSCGRLTQLQCNNTTAQLADERLQPHTHNTQTQEERKTAATRAAPTHLIAGEGRATREGEENKTDTLAHKHTPAPLCANTHRHPCAQTHTCPSWVPRTN